MVSGLFPLALYMELLYNDCGVLFGLSLLALYIELLYYKCDVLFGLLLVALHKIVWIMNVAFYSGSNCWHYLWNLSMMTMACYLGYYC